MITFNEWLESFMALHQVGFMSNNKNTVEVIKQGKLKSKTGLLWLRPESSHKLFAQTPEYIHMGWVKVEGNPNILKVKNREELMSLLGLQGHTDDPKVAKQVAKKLRELGYDGFERLDFPEIAILDTVPHKVISGIL